MCTTDFDAKIFSRFFCQGDQLRCFDVVRACQNELVNEVIEQAAVAVAAVLDQSVWALESTEIVVGCRVWKISRRSVRVAQAALAHELAGRDWPKMHGSTSTANFLRDHLRVSGTAAERLLKLGAMLDRREAMGPAMSPRVAGAGAVRAVGRAGRRGSSRRSRGVDHHGGRRGRFWWRRRFGESAPTAAIRVPERTLPPVRIRAVPAVDDAATMIIRATLIQ